MKGHFLIIKNDNIFQEFADVLFLIENERHIAEKFIASIVF